jgi:hypothetical protein
MLFQPTHKSRLSMVSLLLRLKMPLKLDMTLIQPCSQLGDLAVVIASGRKYVTSTFLLSKYYPCNTLCRPLIHTSITIFARSASHFATREIHIKERCTRIDLSAWRTHILTGAANVLQKLCDTSYG